MMTFYFSPMSRSTRVHQLIEELGLRDRIEFVQVEIQRADGSGRIDPANPHPEGKVPYLVHDGVGIRESIAIMQYLAELAPEAGLSVAPGHPLRGRYLAWLAWYAGVMEPVYVLALQNIDTPNLVATFRTVADTNARLIEALEAGPWLVGDHYTVADLLISSTFGWMPSLTPDNAALKDWLARCNARPPAARVLAEEQRLLAAA